MESLSQYNNLALLAVRLVLAVVFLYHGWGKIMQAKNGYRLLGVWEMVWALAALLGLFARPAGAALGLVMIGATYMKIWKWHMPFSAQDKTGYEFDLALLALCLVLLVFGAGGVSVDARL